MTVMNRVAVSFFTLCAAVALAGAYTDASADPGLGRLFYTPAERTQMEQRTMDENLSAERETVRLDGRIRRSDGKTTNWVNGSFQSDAMFGQAAGKLKVGQSVEAGSGEARDLLRGGSIAVHQRDPK